MQNLVWLQKITFSILAIFLLIVGVLSRCILGNAVAISGLKCCYWGGGGLGRTVNVVSISIGVS